MTAAHIQWMWRFWISSAWQVNTLNRQCYMHNTWPAFWHPSSNADLRKYGFVRQGIAPSSREKCGSHGIRKTVFHYWTCNEPKCPFISSYLKIPFAAVKRLNPFAWNLHLEMTCLLQGSLSFCFHIPFSPSVTKPGSISICKLTNYGGCPQTPLH